MDISMEFGAIYAGVLGLCLAAGLYVGPKRIKHYIQYAFAYLFVCYHKRKSSKRLSKEYEVKKAGASVEELGIVPRQLEYQLENPQQSLKEGFSDGVHIFGVDENQNSLDIIVNQISPNQATLWIILKIAGDDTYELPRQPDTRYPYIRNNEYFSAGGLQIQCCSPLRRWRISFNGELKKVSASDEDLIHVKFSFVWLGMCLVHDLKTDYSSAEVTKAFFDTGVERICDKDLQSFEEHNDRYEQWGQLMGTVKFDKAQEKELYLWSPRSRLLGCTSSPDEKVSLKIFSYFKNGLALKIEITSVEGLFKNYVDAYLISTGGSNTNISNVELNIGDFMKGVIPNEATIAFKNRGTAHHMSLYPIREKMRVKSGKNLELTTIMTSIQTQMNDEDGFGIIYSSFRSKFIEPECNHIPKIFLIDKGYIPTKTDLVMDLDHENCQSSLVAGGKGSSLALLSKLSKETKLFSVSEGFVVTTKAFEIHVEEHENLKDVIDNLRKVSCGKIAGDLKEACERCCKEFSSTQLTSTLKSTIIDQIVHKFGSIENVNLAVRSSAYGEDSQELSCAGVMSTFLGVKGLNNVFTAVANCWSSHYRFEAVQYLRQNGQPLNSPMAVVIQEMVAADVAGVMFTVDPVTGNPAYPVITANFGLGETVVSAFVEPDTYVLKKGPEGLLSLFEQTLGQKNVQEVLKSDGGTERQTIPSERNNFCLTKDWALKIGDMGMFVAQCYCAPRDIEWALMGKKLFFLQARPITTLHRESDFEIIHEQDTPIRSSYEYYTRANTGEVFLGSSSPLSLSLVIASMDINSQRNFVKQQRDQNLSFVPYVWNWLPSTHRQVALNLTNSVFRTNEKTITSTQKAFEVALFGRVFDADDIHRCGVKKFGYIKWYQKIRGLLILTSLFLKPLHLEKVSKRVNELNIEVGAITTAEETFQSICSVLQLYFEAATFHGFTTFLSSIYNNIILVTLAKGEKAWDNTLFGDIANLLSSCQGVESAEVPSLLEELAKTISATDGETFSSVPVEVAFSLLKNDKGPCGKLFKDFLKKHGHRCVKEFDVHSKSWRMEPENLIHILQNMVKSTKVINSSPKQSASVNSAINELKTPLTRFSRLLLKMILPRSRIAVGKREQSKSLLIKVIDWLRQLCYHMGELLVKAELIPDRDLLFFLTLEEIKQLIEKKFVPPNLITKAMRRRQIHPTLNMLQFPEIMAGIPKPVEKIDESEIQLESLDLKGTPVCSGIVKARARVVLQLEEAASIKIGEILVTHATDVGWTPYFPLLTGVITVLGGLISHGAVVAREYGLPCIVGVQNATTLIKSGDLIILDGNNGTVTKIKENFPASGAST